MISSLISSPVRSLVSGPMDGGGYAAPSWSPQSWLALDNTTDQSWALGSARGVVSSIPGLTVSRASGGYAERADGTLISFGANTLRLTDRGILVEPQAVNLFSYSIDYTNAAWTKTNATITPAARLAPDGTMTMSKLVATAVSGIHDVRRSIACTAGAAITDSVLVEAGEYAAFQVQLFGGGGGSTVNVDLVAGTATAVGAYGGWSSPSASVRRMGTSNWWYITHTVTVGAAVTSAFSSFALCNTPGNGVFTGDGTSGACLWNAQRESTAYATSPIITTTAAATRFADNISVDLTHPAYAGNPLTYPLTIFAEFQRVAATGLSEMCANLRVDPNNRFGLGVSSLSETEAQAVAGGVNNSVGVAGAVGLNTVIRQAARYGLNDVRASRGGLLGVADTVAALPTTPPVLQFSSNGGSHMVGYLRRIAITKGALTDAQLQAMTA